MKHMEIKVPGDDQVFVGCEGLVSKKCSALFTEDCIDDAFCMLYTSLVKRDTWLKDDKDLSDDSGKDLWIRWVKKNIDAEAPQRDTSITWDWEGEEGESWIESNVEVPAERLLYFLQLSKTPHGETYPAYLMRVAEASLQYIISEILYAMGKETLIHWQEQIVSRQGKPKPADMRSLIDLTFPIQKNVKGVVYPNPTNAGGKHD